MKSKIIFLPIPVTLREQLAAGAQADFPIDPDIPLPVEIGGDNEQINIDMILSGMMHILRTKEAKQEWLDYYASFVLYLRPDILSKIQEIKDSGLEDENFLNAHKLIQEGKPEEGLKFIREFIEERPLVWNGWFILGWALRLLGKWTEAETALRKAIELDGDGSDTRNELAICLMEKGDISGAGRELETALKKDPENVKIISNLGVLALKEGNNEKAAAFFRTVLEIDDSDPVAKNYMEKS